MYLCYNDDGDYDNTDEKVVASLNERKFRIWKQPKVWFIVSKKNNPNHIAKTDEIFDLHTLLLIIN